MLNIIQNDAKKASKKLNYSKLHNKSVLVTGATGLIGLHIVALLQELKIDCNIEVTVWASSPIDTKINEIFKNCKIIIGDLTDANNIKNLNAKYDYIIHAAGYAQPQKFTGDKMNTIKLNTETTTNLFSLLKKDGTFVFCSTSELYSGLLAEKIDEKNIGTTNPEHPRACYIESKRCGETICYAFHEKGFDIKIARISLAYGPGTRLNDLRVMNSIIEKALVSNKITLLDAGRSIRTYGYVMDLVEMLWNITLHGKEIVYNVCGNSKISIAELAQTISKKLNCDLIIPCDDSKSLSGNPILVDISFEKYKKEFGEPIFTEMDEGINKTISWQKYICNIK